MDKNLIKYWDKKTNVYVGLLKLKRESTPSGAEYITIYPPDDESNGEYEKLYHLWYNPNSIKKNDKNPKHTGGKKPYLMLMINEIENLRDAGIKNVEELIGYVACLGKYIEWNTGKLIHKRSKKPIQYKDLEGIYRCSNKKLNKMINLMKEHDLLHYTDEGYFISSKYVKKGKKRGEG